MDNALGPELLLQTGVESNLQGTLPQPVSPQTVFRRRLTAGLGMKKTAPLLTERRRSYKDIEKFI